MSLWYQTFILFHCLMGIGVVTSASIDGAEHQTKGRNLLSLERMGAGVPGGWHVSGYNYQWAPEQKSGPLGIGAARIQFEGEGRLHLVSPARFMRSGVSHAASLWLCSEPAEALVQLTVHDNDSDKATGFGKRAIASETWQQVVVQGVLSKAVKDRYYLTLTAEGKDCTLWLDGLWRLPVFWWSGPIVKIIISNYKRYYLR